jgi:hypothetical protein
VVRLDELGEIGGAHVVFLIAEGVVKVEFVDAELIRHRDIGLVRHALGDPMMAADRFQPPDLAGIAERDPVHLVGAVLLQQCAQAGHAFAGGGDIRQHDGEEILFADAAGALPARSPARLLRPSLQ